MCRIDLWLIEWGGSYCGTHPLVVNKTMINLVYYNRYSMWMAIFWYSQCYNLHRTILISNLPLPICQCIYKEKSSLLESDIFLWYIMLLSSICDIINNMILLSLNKIHMLVHSFTQLTSYKRKSTQNYLSMETAIHIILLQIWRIYEGRTLCWCLIYMVHNLIDILHIWGVLEM